MLRNLLLISITLAMSFASQNINAQIIRSVISTSDTYSPGEFRYEVENSLPGDTVIIDVAGTDTLANPIILSNNVVIIGPQAIHFTLNASGILAPSVFVLNGNSIYINGISMISAPANTNWFSLNGAENLSLQRCVVRNNNESPIYVSAGSTANVKLESCSFMYNLSTTRGGAIYMDDGVLEVINSTFNENQASAGGSGGAIFFGSPNTCKLINSTFYNNGTSPWVPGGAVDNYFSNGSIITQNSLYYNQPASDTILAGYGYTSNGGNFINSDFPPFSVVGNVVGSGLNPQLNNLTIDGFGLEYFTLKPVSPCIDIGNPTGLTKYDQRRVWRDMDAGPNSVNIADAGAVEYSPFTVNSTNASGPGTFNQAVIDINGGLYIGKYAIVFEHAGLGPFTTPITTTSTLTIPDVIINGYSQNGSNIPGPTDNAWIVTPGYTPVEFDGGGTANNFLNVNFDSVIVAGLSIMNYNVGISITGSAAKIEGCHIGVDAYGMFAAPNSMGLEVITSLPSGGAFIGANEYLGNHHNNSRNVISGNTDAQIRIADCGNNVIEGNFIGSASDGVSIPSGSSTGNFGIDFMSSGSAYPGSQVGGYDEYEENLIVNQAIGMKVSLNNIQILYNLVGSDYYGYPAGVPTDFDLGVGIKIDGPTAIDCEIVGNVVGNTTAAGINLTNLSSNTVVYENGIGLSEDGTTPLNNGGHGILVDYDSYFNIIGGVDSLDGNFIANSALSGIAYLNMTAPSLDTIHGNFIGLDTMLNPAGNSVGISFGSNTQDVMVGDTIFGYGNQIAFNTNAGIGLSNSGVTGIRMTGNSIHNNGALGIDIDQNGPSITTGTAPLSNQSQIPPNLLAVSNCGLNNYTTIKYEVDFPVGSTYQIEFFLADTDNEEGDVYLGAMIINPTTQPDTFYINAPAPAFNVGDVFIATATNLVGPSTFHTSEFSDTIAVTNSSVTAFDASMTYCSDVPGGTTSTIDLVTDLNSIVNGGTGDPVTWFTDANLTAPIGNPNSFIGTTQVIYAGVSNGACMDTAFVNLTVNPSPDVSTFNPVPTDETCAGLCDGTMSYTTGPSGSGETYDFGDGGGAVNSNFSNLLCPGSYTLIFTDANGCVGTDLYFINGASALSVTTTSIDATCNGSSDGQATGTELGGVPPYTYQWDDPSFQTSTTASGLLAGTYTITVTDGNACTANATATVNEPTPVVVVFSWTDVLCFGDATGSITLSGSGGTPGYTYSIDGGASYQGSGNYTGLVAGSYNVMVVDAQGCFASDVVVVNEPLSPITESTSFTQITCFGANDGSITVTPSGGTVAIDYTYFWSPAPGGGQGTNTAFNLSAGTYSCVITDDNGCSIVSTSVIITEPSAISVAPATGTDPLCSGNADGTASISIPAGGTPPYTYQWYDASGPTLLGGLTTLNVTGMPAGTYYCEVLDANGCIQNSGSVTLIDPSVISATISVTTDITCFGSSDGTATVGAAGGTPGYTYNWYDNIAASPIGQTSSTAAGLPASDYYCEVADLNGCIQLSNIITISEPALLNVFDVVDNQITCFGANDGQATVTGSGGTIAVDYTYNWTPAPGFGQGTNVGSSLAPGSYTVDIIDDNGCTAYSAPIVITEPPVLTVSYTQIDPTCNGVCDGQATANVSGGTPGYTFAWSSGGSATTDAGLCAGTHNVTVTDVNGCAVSGGVTLIDPLAVIVSAMGDTTICQGDSILMAGSVFNGVAPYSFSWDNSVIDGTYTTPTVTTTYTVSATDANGCISNADAMTITLDVAPASNAGLDVSVCANNADITLSGSAANSTSINWLGGAGTYNPNNITLNTVYTPTPAEIAAGSLTLTLVANGVGACTTPVTDVMVVTFTPPPTVNAGLDQTICANNTSVSLSSTSSTTVIWTSTGGGTFSPNNIDPNPLYQTTPAAIAAGVDTLFLTTTGNGNCNAVVDTLIITITSPPTVNAGADTTICSGAVANLNGSFSLATSVSWSFNNGDGSFSNATTAISSYTPGPGDNTGNVVSLFLTTTGPTGCVSEMDSMVLTVLAPPATSAITGPLNVCENTTSVVYSVSPTGGSTYTWTLPTGATISAGAGTSSITVDFANTGGTIDVIETNSTGCIGSMVSLAVTVDSAPITSVITGPSNICANSVGVVYNVALTAGSTYSWSLPTGASIASGAGTASITVDFGTIGGNIVVTETSSTGCVGAPVSLITTVTAAPSIVITFADVTCFGLADGTITTTVSGGTAPFQFSIDGGTTYSAGTSPFVSSSLIAGTYNIEVVDGNGCLSNSIAQTIIEPAALAIDSVVSVDESCIGNDGTIDIYGTTGGAPLYNYSIDGGVSFQTDSSFTSLMTGTYPVLIQDLNGCTLNLGNVIINGVVPISISTDFFTNVTCNGLADGTITSFSATGGTGGFTYQWYNTVTGLIGGQTILNATNLPPGSFYIEAMDGTGCTQNSDTVNITEPAPIVLNVTSTNPTCSNTADGTITIDVTSGGTPPFSFSTDGGTVLTASNPPFVAFNLLGGTYSPYVLDTNGCSVTGQPVALTTPSPVITSVVVTDISCFGSADGQFEVTMSGGTPNYTLSTDGGTSFTTPTANPEIINAAVGSFVINVVTMDANGCTSDTVPYTVIEPAQITSTVTTIPDTCSQGIGQIIVSNVTGGAGAPYGYTIDGGATIQSSNVFNVVPGTYNVVVGDINNCVDANLSIVVADISGTLTLAGAYPGDTICPGEPAFVQAYGGSSYNWLTTGVLDPLSDSSEVDPDVSTIYVVEISSGNCMKVDSTEIIVSAEGCDLGTVSNNVFSPDGDGVNETFVLDIQYLLTNDNTVKIYNRWGDLINEFNNYNNVDVFWDGTNQAGTPVTAGTYFYIVEIPTVNYSNSGWIQVVR